MSNQGYQDGQFLKDPGTDKWSLSFTKHLDESLEVETTVRASKKRSALKVSDYIAIGNDYWLIKSDSCQQLRPQNHIGKSNYHTQSLDIVSQFDLKELQDESAINSYKRKKDGSIERIGVATRSQIAADKLMKRYTTLNGQPTRVPEL